MRWNYRLLVLTLAGLLGLSLVMAMSAQDEPAEPAEPMEPSADEPDSPVSNTRTAGVEVRVWQSVRDATNLYVSARPADGAWGTLGTVPLVWSGVSRGGSYRYGDFTIEVPAPGVQTSTTAPEQGGPAPPPEPTLPSPDPATVTVEVRIWQHTTDAGRLYISARERGSWATSGTIALTLDLFTQTRSFRYVNVTIGVPLDPFPLP